MNLDIADYVYQPLLLSFLKEAEVKVHILRLDKIHPFVSGNKLYKLYYFLELALEKNIPLIKTFGGPYSNHLLATACACQQMGFQSIGMIRGEMPPVLNETLIQCQQLGMQLSYLTRDEYGKNCNVFEITENSITIPEGGYHPLGAKGAGLITKIPGLKKASHVVTAVGTATTLAGLAGGLKSHQTLVAVPVLKGFHDIYERLFFLNGQIEYNNLMIANDYHFGGYAKHSNELLDFMNNLYQQTEIPTDFVYTAKMMFAVIDMIKKGEFPKGSNVICIHTGGLQGNRGLPAGSLIF